MGYYNRMDPPAAQDRALKEMLNHSSSWRDGDIPRAGMKQPKKQLMQQPSQSEYNPQSKFRQSIMHRQRLQELAAKKRLNGANSTQMANPPKQSYRTEPIDIATLDLGPTPRALLHNNSRRLGDMRSMGTQTEMHSQSVPMAQSRSLGRPNVSSPVSTKPVPAQRSFQKPGGGGSYLYSGHYDPNYPTPEIITKPVPTARSGYQPTATRNNASNNMGNQMRTTKNPLATSNGGRATSGPQPFGNFNNGDTRAFNLSSNNKFDGWADNLYNNVQTQPQSNKAVVPDVVDRSVHRNNQAQGNVRRMNNPLAQRHQPDDEANADNWGFGGMVGDVAKDEGMAAAQGFFENGELDVGEFGEGMISGMGGKLGEKGGGMLGGKIGKKLGNEKLGEQVGGVAGGVAGEMAGDMAKDMAKDAAGDLLAGGEIDLQPPEIPSIPNLGKDSKCAIV